MPNIYDQLDPSPASPGAYPTVTIGRRDPEKDAQAQRAARSDARAQAEFERKQREWSATHNPDGSPNEGDAALNPQTTAFYAQQILAGGQMPALGMGKAAAAARQEIMREVARQAGANGMTGADLARQMTHYKAGSAQLQQLEKMLGTIQQSEQTALANGQQFIDRSAELPGQTRFPALNSIVQGVERAAGNSTIAAHDAAWNTFANEYAKVISGSPTGAGTLSDSARKEAMAVIRGNYSLDQKKAAFEQMKNDMGNRITAIHQGINSAYEHLTQKPGYEVPATTAALAADVAAGHPDQHADNEVAGQVNGAAAKPPPGSDGGPSDLPPANMPGGNDPTPPTPTSGGSHLVNHPEVASAAYIMMKHGAGYATIKSALGAKGADFTMSDYAEGKKRLAANPNVNPYTFQKSEPTSWVQRAAASAPGAAAVGMTDAMTMGGMDEIAGGLRALKNGTSWSAETGRVKGAEDALGALHPWATDLGEVGGTLAGGLAAGKLLAGAPKLAKAMATLPGTLGTGALYGATQGALSDNEDRAGGAIGGGIVGAGGAALGRYAVSPLLERMMRARAGAPTITAAEAALKPSTIPASVTANLQDADRLGLPYALADADPKLRMLAGSVARKSPDARQLAENTFDPRAMGQADRAVNAIDTHLAPITDVEQRAKDLIAAGNTAADPYYQMAGDVRSPVDPELQGMLRSSSGQDAMARAKAIMSDRGLPDTDKRIFFGPDNLLTTEQVPNFQTLDYIKKGLDARLESERNPITGQLDLQGNPTLQAVDNLRKRYVAKLDTINDAYPKGRAEFQKYAQRRDALDLGGNVLPNNATPMRQFQTAVGGLDEATLPEAQMGYATNMADAAAKARLSANPYDSIYGSPLQQQKVGTLFPEGAPNFDRTYGLEKDMAKTRNETLGGSPTAARMAADQMFDSPLGQAGDLLVQAHTGGGFSPLGIAKALAPKLIDTYKLGLGTKKADAIASVLFNTQPADVLSYLDDLTARQAALQARKQSYGSRGALLGALVTPGLMPTQ